MKSASRDRSGGLVIAAIAAAGAMIGCAGGGGGAGASRASDADPTEFLAVVSEYSGEVEPLDEVGWSPSLRVMIDRLEAMPLSRHSHVDCSPDGRTVVRSTHFRDLNETLLEVWVDTVPMSLRRLPARDEYVTALGDGCISVGGDVWRATTGAWERIIEGRNLRMISDDRWAWYEGRRIRIGTIANGELVAEIECPPVPDDAKVESWAVLHGGRVAAISLYRGRGEAMTSEVVIIDTATGRTTATLANYTFYEGNAFDLGIVLDRLWDDAYATLFIDAAGEARLQPIKLVIPDGGRPIKVAPSGRWMIYAYNDGFLPGSWGHHFVMRFDPEIGTQGGRLRKPDLAGWLIVGPQGVPIADDGTIGAIVLHEDERARPTD